MNDGEDAPPPEYNSVVIEQQGNQGQMEASGSAGSKEADLQVRVYDPVKQGDGIGAYVSYRVETKTELPQYQQRENEVIRRFKDFVWLQERLGEKNPGAIVPALPEKDVVQKFSLGTDFVHKRCNALNKFLSRVTLHPVLKFSSELQFFLEANEQAWQAEVARTSVEQGAVKNTLLGAKSFFKNVTQTASNMISGKIVEAEEDPEYIKVRTYVTALETHLTEVHRHAEKMVVKQEKLTRTMNSFGKALDLLGETEEKEDLKGEFSKVAQKIATITTETEKRLTEVDQNFVEPMKEYARTARSVKAVMNDRSSTLSRVQEKRQSVERKKQNLAKLRATPGAKEEKLSDAEQRLNESSRKLEDAKEKFEVIKERLKTEMKSYHLIRRDDMVGTLKTFAASQAEIAREQAKHWRDLLEELSPLAA